MRNITSLITQVTIGECSPRTKVVVQIRRAIDERSGGTRRKVIYSSTGVPRGRVGASFFMSAGFRKLNYYR